MSPLVAGLRGKYMALCVPRRPKKEVVSCHRAEAQGAIIDGEAGMAFPKPDKILKYVQLALRLLEQTHCIQKQAQALSILLCLDALLGALNETWKFIKLSIP